MLNILWNTRGYFFWLLVVSAGCMILEAVAPWRPKQRQFRRQFAQDLFWLVFNGHYASIAVAFLAQYLLVWIYPVVEKAEQLNLIAAWPIWAQLVVFFVLKDFLEWCAHNLLHRVPFLWTFHKLHHSIEELDWIGNFRFHWMEIIIYKSLTYFPLVVLGIDGRIILWIAILTTVIGHFNHSNLNISWGPLRYLINSPRMHVWHHMYALPENRHEGVNFGIPLSIWDWIFHTSYWPDKSQSPEQQPNRLGFPGIESFPRSLLGRLIYPISALWNHGRQ